VSRVKVSLDHKRIRRLFWLVLTVIVLLGYSLQSVMGSTYYSMLMQAYATVNSPPVILQNGTAGTSTIYTNSTSAKVSVSGYGYDFVDNNDTDVDLSANIGTHTNFTAQKYGPDLINDTLTEGNFTVEGQTALIQPFFWLDVNSRWDNEANAFDWDNSTSAIENQARINNDIYWRPWNNSGSGPIIDVDLRIRIDLTGLVNDYLTIQWWVGSTQGTGTYEINSTNDGTDLTISFNDLSEPNDGSWSWTDIGAIEIRQVGTKVGGNDAITYAVDEVWGRVTTGSPENYELDLEVQWTNVDYDEPNEELCIYGGTMGAENITVDAWNGSDWENVLTYLNSGWNNVSVSSYLTSSNFTVRFKGGNETSDTTQDSWNIDATLLHLWRENYDYVLRVNNTVTDSWQIRLKKYADSNINRLQNCTIYFHNSSDGTSRQIYIQNGAYINQTGPWYDLGDSETIYIAMTVEANSIGTSYVYVFLEILTPSTTTYSQHIITFEIT